MNKSALIAASLVALVAVYAMLSRQIDSETTITSLSTSAPDAVSSGIPLADVAEANVDPIQSAPLQDQINTRLANNPSDESINQLGSQLARYNSLTEAEKSDLLTAYATLFLRNSQYDDARFFYEQILLLPNLDQTNRLAILQLLTRIAIASEDWNGFLVYNDQYFNEGGVYNWVVTGNLLNAWQRLGNFDAAGQALLLHLETGLNPNFDGSDQQYQRYYGNAQNIPLQVSNTDDAIAIAKGLVDQFDRPENWRVLAEVYQSAGDQSNLVSVMETARSRGFLDGTGNWLVSDYSQ